MNKYIRTKDSILDTKNLIKVEYEDGRFKNIYRNARYFLYKAIKEADTIEELCDGFYIDVLGDGAFNFDGLYVYNDFDDFKEHYISYHNYDDVENGYGFIKTNKGLIYVAKMNDRGKLELI